MIWHVYAEEFVRFLLDVGFHRIVSTERHDIFERGAERVQVRRADRLTRQEVDLICDAADLDPPLMTEEFGD